MFISSFVGWGAKLVNGYIQLNNFLHFFLLTCETTKLSWKKILLEGLYFSGNDIWALCIHVCSGSAYALTRTVTSSLITLFLFIVNMQLCFEPYIFRLNCFS